MFHSIPIKKIIKREKNYDLYKTTPEILVVEIINDLLAKEDKLNHMIYISFQNMLNQNYETMMSIIYSLKQNAKEAMSFSQCFTKKDLPDLTKIKLSENFKSCVDKFYALLELSEPRILKKFGEVMETLPHDKRSAIFLLKLKILMRTHLSQKLQKGGRKATKKVVVSGNNMLLVDDTDTEYTKIQGTGLSGAIASFFKNTINSENPGELDDATKNLFRLMHTFYANNMNMFVIVISKIMNHLYGTDFKFVQEEGAHGEEMKKKMSEGDSYNKAVPFFDKFFEFQQYTHKLDVQGVDYKEDENYNQIMELENFAKDSKKKLMSQIIDNGKTPFGVGQKGGEDYKEKFKQYLFDLTKLKKAAGNSINSENYTKYRETNSRMVDDLSKKQNKMETKDLSQINPAIVGQAKKKKSYFIFLSIKKILLEEKYKIMKKNESERIELLNGKKQKISSFPGTTIDYDDINNKNPTQGMSLELAKKKIDSEIALAEKKIKEYDNNSEAQQKLIDTALSDLTTFCKKNGINQAELGDPDYTEFLKKDIAKVKSEIAQLQMQWKTIAQDDIDITFKEDIAGLIDAEIEKRTFQDTLVDVMIDKSKEAISSAKEKMKSVIEQAKSNFNITADEVTKAGQEAANTVANALRNTSLNVNVTQTGGDMEAQDRENYVKIYTPSAKVADTINKFMDKIATSLQNSDGFNKLKGLMSADSISKAIDMVSNAMSASMTMPMLYMGVASDMMNVFGSQAAAQLGTSSIDKSASKEKLVNKLKAIISNIENFKRVISKQIICTEKKIFEESKLQKEILALIDKVSKENPEFVDCKEDPNMLNKLTNLFKNQDKNQGVKPAQKGGDLKKLQEQEKQEVEYLSKLLNNYEKSFQTPGEVKIFTLYKLYTDCVNILKGVPDLEKPAELPLDNLKTSYIKLKGDVDALKKYLNENKSKLLAKIDTKTEKDFQTGGGNHDEDFAEAFVKTIQEMDPKVLANVTRDGIIEEINKELSPPEPEPTPEPTETTSATTPTTPATPTTPTTPTTPATPTTPVTTPSTPVIPRATSRIKYNTFIPSFIENLLTIPFSKDRLKDTKKVPYFSYLDSRATEMAANNNEINDISQTYQRNLRIISNNIYGCQDRYNKYNEKTIDDLLSYDPDILCIQETTNNSGFKAKLHQYKEITYSMNSMNSIYVKKTINVRQHINIPLPGNRNAIAIMIDNIAIINTHLAHQGTTTVKSDELRTSQVNGLLVSIKNSELYNIFKTGKMFIVGDMNARFYENTTQPTLQEKSVGTFLKCFDDVFDKNVPPMTHWSGYRIDYIFANTLGFKSVKGAYLLQNANSDHMPLIVDVA